jgi:hypothetical protein
LEGENFQEYLDTNENQKLKNIVKKLNSKIESTLSNEIPLRNKFMLPLDDESFSKSSSWMTEKSDGEPPNGDLQITDLDDSLKFYVNEIR